MGTWSVDAFGNDDAADWAYEIEEAQDLSPIEQAIDAVLAVGDDYLDASVASIALAAIEVLARLGGNAGEHTADTETVDRWIAQTSLLPGVELVDKAQAAIARIVADDSELKELWAESDELDAWLAAVEDLRVRVGD